MLGGLGDHHAATIATRWCRHYDIQPAFDIYATTQDRDLGARRRRHPEGDQGRPPGDVPKGATVTLRGQVATMNTAFSGLLFGLVGAIVLIYLLIVVNFQSWLDPFVIITALPAALAGIVWMLFATGTTLSVPGADRRDHVHGRGHGQLASWWSASPASGWRRPATRSPRRSRPASPASARC